MKKFVSETLDDLIGLVTDIPIKIRAVNKIREAMKLREMNQKQLAKAVNKTEAEVSKWLSGKHNLTLDTLELIEKTLKIKLI